LAFAALTLVEFVFSASPAAFAFEAFAAVLVLELLPVVFSTGVSGLLDKTETFPCKAGIEINNADTIKIVAVTIVIFDKTVAVPRGPKALLEILLVKSAPASVLPG
jgi:hypothetical protein